MKIIEIYNDEIKLGKDKYTFIIKEKYIDGWGKINSKNKTRPKFYEIKKNGETILHTSLHQTFNSYRKKIIQCK